MKKLVTYGDGSCVLKNSTGNSLAVFSSMLEYELSPFYSTLIPVVQSGAHGSAGIPIKKSRSTVIPGEALAARPNFKFGADPEGFVVDAAGKAVAPSMIPGSKDSPHKVDGGAVQRDGMAAEYNIDVATNFDEWNSNHEKVQKALQGFLPKDHKILWAPAIEFTPDVFDNAPDDYKELGCSPDWDAWAEDLNPPPFCEDRPYLRTASGHIHIGWGDDYSLDNALHQRNCFDLVKQLDWYLAGWSLKHDADATRRALYGKAGACRLKSYGVEYRVLSNFWVTTKERRKSVWNRLQMAIADMEPRFMPERAPEGFNQKLIESINTGKMEADFKKACRFPFSSVEPGLASF